MGKKRYNERTKKESALPLGLGGLLGVDDTYHSTTVRDNKTGSVGRGTGKGRSESRSKAWKDLREKRRD